MKNTTGIILLILVIAAAIIQITTKDYLLTIILLWCYVAVNGITSAFTKATQYPDDYEDKIK